MRRNVVLPFRPVDSVQDFLTDSVTVRFDDGERLRVDRLFIVKESGYRLSSTLSYNDSMVGLAAVRLRLEREERVGQPEWRDMYYAERQKARRCPR